ncbi:MAG: hypothetical protein VR67_05490 [Peptococcaceae bacterium BRH_c8a]|nr:MAG: hypothetical protein VR67_05490 [Peptococcaceae bacterium BRH_c8a]
MAEIKMPNINHWEKEIDSVVWRLIKFKKGTSTKLNLGHLNFIEPSGAILLILICNYVFNLTGVKVEITNVKPQVLSYFNRILFFNVISQWAFTNDKISWWQKVHYNQRSLSVVEITLLEQAFDVYNFTQKCQSIIRSWFPESYQKEYCDRAMTVVMEVCSNALDHSGSEAYAMLQKYSRGYGSQIKISVGDMGIGIREHLLKAHRWVGSHDTDFIEKALNGLSGRQNSSGGFGLKRIQEITAKHKGKVLLRSGKGMVEIENGLKKYYFNYSFPGTQYLIELRNHNC